MPYKKIKSVPPRKASMENHLGNISVPLGVIFVILLATVEDVFRSILKRIVQQRETIMISLR